MWWVEHVRAQREEQTTERAGERERRHAHTSARAQVPHSTAKESLVTLDVIGIAKRRVCIYSISGMIKIKIKIKSGLVRVVNDETGVTSWCTRGLSLLLAHVAHAPEPRETRRSRTTARSESSTSPSTHRPPIESSSSSRWLA